MSSFGEINPRYRIGIRTYRGKEKCILRIFILLPKMCYVFGKVLMVTWSHGHIFHDSEGV